MKLLSFQASALFFLTFVHNSLLAQNLSITVVSIGDGDTLRIRRSGQVTTIRLGCIDAPETSQNPFGEKSTFRLKQLLPLGTAVKVREIDRDRYGRTVAELFIANKSINLQMLKINPSSETTQNS